VNAVSPGPIETPIFGRMGLSAEQVEGFGQSMMQQVPMKRLGQPEEIAKAVLFLASSDSSYVLGTELVVDGGMTQL
jgi:NAD(P)-dependent dehydrogenase (short-subunit alcohol dehydrogenase family)